LEARYAAFPGLNLTREVLDGQATRADKAATYGGKVAPLLEVQVVEAADSMTYDAHDTDDAVKLRLVALAELAANTLIREALEQVRGQYANVRPDLLRKAVVHQLIDRQVTDVLQFTASALAAAGPLTAEEIRRTSLRVGPSSELAQQKLELERFLYDRVYRHPELIAVRSQAQGRLRELFQRYVQRPELLPVWFQERAKAVGLERAVGDYLAGMTDRFCDQQYEQLAAS
jgi:dGTPase